MNTTHLTDAQLIEGLRREDRRCQRRLYERYSGLFFSVCLRYLKQGDAAEDAMVEGFFKVMTKIGSYTGQGNFEGWMRRIMINECLMRLRKQKSLGMTVELEDHSLPPEPAGVLEALAGADILQLLDRLPTGYRTVFNLYVVEGYKHREIAEELGISINTSKSQLILAKKRLRELLHRQDRDLGFGG